jgi:Fe2+ transport system protein B
MKLILEENLFSKANKKTLTRVSILNAIAFLTLIIFPAGIVGWIATIILLPGLFILAVLLLPLGNTQLLEAASGVTFEGILIPILLLLSTIISILFYTSCIRGIQRWKMKQVKNK